MGALRPGTLARDGAWQQLTQRPVLLRAALDALATMAYLTSLFHLPIGNASAINMASPMFIALYAAVVWRERVSPARWLAIAGGFTGVLLIVQPAAEAFNAWSLMCLFATLLHTGRDLITRRIALTVPSILITLTTSIAVLLLTGPWSLLQGWQPVDGDAARPAGRCQRVPEQRLLHGDRRHAQRRTQPGGAVSVYRADLCAGCWAGWSGVMCPTRWPGPASC